MIRLATLALTGPPCEAQPPAAPRRRLEAPTFAEALGQMFAEIPMSEGQASSIRLAVCRFEGVLGFRELTEENLAAYQTARREAGKSPTTIRAEVKRLRCFAVWLAGKEVVPAPCPPGPDNSLPPSPAPETSFWSRIFTRKGGDA